MFYNEKNRLIVCSEFAFVFIDALCRKDLSTITELIDENETGMELDYIVSGAGDLEFLEIENIEDWSLHILAAESKSFDLHFHIPFKGNYRHAMAKFFLSEKEKKCYNVVFEGFDPS